MRRLAGYTCDPLVDACFAAMFIEALEPRKREEHRRWRRVYLGRYMRQPMDLLDDMPVEEIEAYVEITHRFIQIENGKTKVTEQVAKQETDYG